MRRWTPLLRTGIGGVRPVPLGARHGSRLSFSTVPMVSSCFTLARGASTLTGRRRIVPDTATQGQSMKRHGSRRHLPVLTSAYGRALPGRAQEGRKIGHDSYFIAETEKFTVLGVADGVGSWVDHGVDPSDFSFCLMDNCRQSALGGVALPLSILKEGYSALQAVRPQIIGSSTACLAVIQGRMLKTANLGDSGFVVIRQSSVVHASSPQQHFTNCPFQLSILQKTEEQERFKHDSPEKADLTTFRLEPRDIIALGTDGLLENLTQEKIVDIAASLKGVSQESLSKLAKSLVDEAGGQEYKVDEMSPNAREAQRYATLGYLGDKPDDITVVLAAIVDF